MGELVARRQSVPDGVPVDHPRLQRYATQVNGVQVRFLLYRKPDGSMATVFDACEICGGVGYYKTSQGVVCKNCGAPINGATVGHPGGCNPVPLQATVSGGQVLITEAEVAAGSRYFQK